MRLMKRRLAKTVVLVAIAGLTGVQFGDVHAGDDTAASVSGTPTGDGLAWHDNYAQAQAEAKRREKMLLIHFVPTEPHPVHDAFQNETMNHPDVVAKLGDYVLAKLPLDAEIVVQGETSRLIDDPSLKEMLRRPGIAIIDYANLEAEHYNHVVSTFPLDGSTRYSPTRMKVILDLPAGTLTQRTMVFAVRTHSENPASTVGHLSPVLSDEAENHSQHQANIGVQGHHAWNTRFHRINRRLANASSSEVVAESWPGENLVEAAIECVRSWRQSPGHWGAVRKRQQMFAYDIKRGSNGVWYATGIFANRR